MLNFFKKTLPEKETSQKKPSEKKEKGETLTSTKTWYQDRYETVVVQRNALMLITCMSIFGMVGAVLAVTALSDAKTFEPYVIQVEDKTGIVTQVSRRTVEKYTADESLIRSLLVNYIRAREAYNVDDYQYFYNKVVRLMSSTGEYSRFRQLISTSNPDSPVNLARGGIRKVDIKSITFLEDKKAQVRVAIKEYKIPHMSLGRTMHRILTINFDFLSLEISQQDRYINPLGFQITGYRSDKEDDAGGESRK